MGIVHIQGAGALGESLGGLPVLGGHQGFDQVDQGVHVLGIFGDFLHERADGVAAHARRSLGRGLHMHGDLRLFEAFRKGNHQHGRQTQSQQQDQRARRSVELGQISHG